MIDIITFWGLTLFAVFGIPWLFVKLFGDYK